MTSTFFVGHEQKDGRRYVTETHALDSGDVKNVEYLASPGTDYQAVMDARAASILADAIESEAQSNLAEILQ